MALQLVTFIMANSDVNSRQASTSPYYFWFYILNTQDVKTPTWVKLLLVGHNLGYLAANLAIMPLDIGFL